MLPGAPTLPVDTRRDRGGTGRNFSQLLKITALNIPLKFAKCETTAREAFETIWP